MRWLADRLTGPKSRWPVGGMGLEAVEAMGRVCVRACVLLLVLLLLLLLLLLLWSGILVGLPFELGLHQPLLAGGVVARPQHRRGRIFVRGPRQTVARVDVLDRLVL